MTVRLGAVLWLLSAIIYFVVEAYAAAVIPTYSYAADFISTLGIPEVSPRASMMNAAFIVQAVAFPVGGWLLVSGSRSAMATPFRFFLICNGVGNVLVAVVHSGTGSPWHGLGAALAIAGGNLVALTGAWALNPRGRTSTMQVGSFALGAIGLLCLPMLPTGMTHIGLWERGSVYSIYVWQTLAAVVFLVTTRSVTTSRAYAGQGNPPAGPAAPQS